MGGKKKKRTVPKSNFQKTPKNLQSVPQPVRRWWNAMLDTNKIIAGGTVAAAFLAAAAIYYSNRQWHQEHRPHVVFSRPIEMLEPMSCDPATGQGSAHFKVWVKNIGNEDAQSVLPIPMVQLIFETPEGQERKIKDIISFGQSFCSSVGKIAADAPGFPLPVDKETSVNMPSSMASSDYPKNRRMQAFAMAVVYYREQNGTPHETVETEWLMLPDGTRSFICGAPITGQFDVYPAGSCEN